MFQGSSQRNCFGGVFAAYLVSIVFDQEELPLLLVQALTIDCLSVMVADDLIRLGMAMLRLI